MNKKSSTHIRLKFDPYWYPYFVYVGFKHKKIFIINLILIEIEIYWSYKDWLIEKESFYSNGKKYKSMTRNPKYKDEEIKSFMFPPDKYGF